MKLKEKYLLLVLIVLSGSCVQQYTPPAVKLNNNFLVVDGVISGVPDSTTITLSRARNLADTGLRLPEINAQLIIQGQNGTSFPLTDLGNGQYSASNLLLDVSQNYRLSITTSDNVNYLSDYVPYKAAPPIDSVTWQREDDGVHIFVSTHDDKNSTLYYRWDYLETWQYTSAYDSYYSWVNGGPVLRPFDQHIYTCYNSLPSSNIFIATSKGLARDVVSDKELQVVPISSPKIGIEYSILVEQYALTDSAYNFWLSLLKVSQQLGGLFDAQPSQLNGNIHCTTNPSETVIGYISASTKQSSRIFISIFQVLPWVPPVFDNCDTVVIHSASDAQAYFDSGFYIPIDFENGLGPLFGASALCVDCRLQGGTTTKPLYWP